jgi:hypothetical protein
MELTCTMSRDVENALAVLTTSRAFGPCVSELPRWSQVVAMKAGNRDVPFGVISKGFTAVCNSKWPETEFFFQKWENLNNPSCGDATETRKTNLTRKTSFLSGTSFLLVATRVYSNGLSYSPHSAHSRRPVAWQSNRHLWQPWSFQGK